MNELARIERDKYMKVWESKDYRRDSPGMLEVLRAYTECQMKSGETLIDYGSGPCRATKWFQDKGLFVMGIDIAPNACETNVTVVEACLWDTLDEISPADYSFCCDVMEHIPKKKVDTVLANISRLTLKSAYFRIATRPDVFGPALLGEPLHLTVKPGVWWLEKIKGHFKYTRCIKDTGRDVIIITR